MLLALNPWMEQHQATILDEPCRKEQLRETIPHKPLGIYVRPECVWRDSAHEFGAM